LSSQKPGFGKASINREFLMKYSCIHTHTHFCDGKGDVESFCVKAWEKGFDSLGFSSHAPVFRKTGITTDWNVKEERLEAYLDEVRAAKRRWEGRLSVYLGLEVDFIPGLMGPADRDYRDMGLDYIIGSVHFVVPPRGAPFTVDGPPEELETGIREGWGGDARGVVNAYWDSVEAMLRAGGLDVLGHPDLIKKNNPQNRWFSEEDEFYRRRTAAAAALSAQTGVTAEINTGGMNRKRISVPYPSPAFLKLFRENRVPMVINADAHRCEDLDGHYGEAREALLAAGYTETVLFGGRKDGLARWESEKL
jgi:histidinol-phosphatase (PHP family)